MKGYRTYIAAGVLSVISALHIFGVLDPEQAKALEALATAAMGSFLRSAMK